MQAPIAVATADTQPGDNPGDNRMEQQDMTDQQEQASTSTEVAIRDEALIAKFAEMVTLIPLEDGGGAERILEQILSASQWDQLDAPWESSKVDQLKGRRLWLSYAERRPSDYRDGLGMFLVLHCADQKTGDEVVVTSSSLSVMGQVTRAYALNALPLLVEFIIAERATQRGYHPHHLKVWASGATQQEQASASS